MRIGIDGHMLGDHSGGNESYYSNILANMDTGSDEVILFVSKKADVSFLSDKFTIVRFEKEGAFGRNFVEIPKLCKKYKLDVLHMQYFIPFRRPCPVVVTIHDICFEHYKNIFTKKEYFRQKLLIPYAARKSRAVFTVSENAKEDIVSSYHINPKKVFVTYNAVDSSFRCLDPAELNESDLRSKFDIGDCPYILSVGNLQPRKNLPRLIRAFLRMQKKSGTDIKLVIVGKKAWMTEDIMKEALSSSNRVVLTDYVSNEDLVRLYNAALCFVYPSFFEGFGIPPLEAMACGTPVAVSDRTSLPEVVSDAGIYFDPFSEEDIERAVTELVTDQELRQKLIALGYERAKHFSWKKSAEIIMKVYHAVLRDKSGKGRL